MNTSNMNNVVAKIYFDSIGGQTVYNTFVTQEKIFKSKREKLVSYFYLAFSKIQLDQLLLFLTVWHNLLFF